MNIKIQEYNFNEIERYDNFKKFGLTISGDFYFISFISASILKNLSKYTFKTKIYEYNVYKLTLTYSTNSDENTISRIAQRLLTMMIKYDSKLYTVVIISSDIDKKFPQKNLMAPYIFSSAIINSACTYSYEKSTVPWTIIFRKEESEKLSLHEFFNYSSIDSNSSVLLYPNKYLNCSENGLNMNEAYIEVLATIYNGVEY